MTQIELDFEEKEKEKEIDLEEFATIARKVRDLHQEYFDADMKCQEFEALRREKHDEWQSSILELNIYIREATNLPLQKAAEQYQSTYA